MANTATSPILQLIRRLNTDPRVKDASDQELLLRLLGERDETAFEVLLRRHGTMVLDVCRSVLGNEADAEDAFQATFLTLARKADSIRKAASLASWLHGVAYRTALRERANSARRQRYEARAPQRNITTDADDLTWREVRQAIHEELNRLPEQHRAALVLCYLEGKTQDEAAARLGLPKGTLKGHLERGRALLRTRLARRDLRPGALLVLGAWPAASGAVCLSPSLLVGTGKAATAVAAGHVAISVVSPKVAALIEGMMPAMCVKQLTIAAVLCLAIACTGAGFALVMRGPLRADAGQVVEQPAPQEGRGTDSDPRPKLGADPDQPMRTLSGHKERVTSVAYSSDGRCIATAGWDGTIRLWDPKTGQELHRLEVPPTKNYNPAYLSQILFSPDSEFVVVAQQSMPNEPGVIVWRRRTGERVRHYPGLCTALSPDGELIACGGWGRPDPNRGDIRLYEFATGKLVREIHSPYSRIDLVTFSQDGKTLFAQVGIPRPPLGNGIERLGRDGSQVRAWDVATGKERRTELEGAWNEHQIAISPDGRTLALASSLRELATGKERARLTGHADAVCAVAFSPDGRTIASGSMDGTVRLWDLPSAKEIGRFGKEVDPFKGGWVLAVAFAPDGRTVVSGGLDQSPRIWDVSRITGRRREPAERSPADLEADWKDLAGDAAAGYAALCRLVSSPVRAVPFLGKRLQTMEPVDTKRIERLIADLDADQFQARDQAMKDLVALGGDAVPSLRKALAGSPSLEAKRRLEALLDRLDGASPSPNALRQIRAVEALEAIASSEACRLLDKLAAGKPEMRATHEAISAAARLARRAAVAP
jgi:RNA polymerase sigma factor (sigma-70 family)